MSPAFLLLLALGLGLAGWLAARARAWSFRRAAPGRRLAALPSYHAWYVALWIAVPVLLFVIAWSAIAPQLVAQSVLASPGGGGPAAVRLAARHDPRRSAQRRHRRGAGRVQPGGARPRRALSRGDRPLRPDRPRRARWSIAFLGGAWSFLRVKPDFAARTSVERAVMTLLLLASLVAILTTLGIFVSLVFETVRFFGMVSPVDFLFGTHWGPDPMSSADEPRSVALRRAAAVLGNDLHRRDHRHAGRDPARPDERDLPDPVCPPAGAQGAQARARDPRRRADRGLRLLRRAERGAGRARSRAVGRASPTPRARARSPRGWSWG